MAARDLPAMLTHELLHTGAPSLSYIGHSQGTTIGMAFLSSHAGTALAERIDVSGSWSQSACWCARCTASC
jgi:pimeloyl-ACP methyl ester carboxylesterase